MTWIWAVLGIVVGAVVAGLVIVYSTMRRRLRRQLALQARQAAEFPDWARENGYAYSAAFPDSDVERLRGLGLSMRSAISCSRARSTSSVASSTTGSATCCS